MSEKDKRKQGDQRQAPFWIYRIFWLVLLIAFCFPLFHLLRAYPYVNVYQLLAPITAIGLSLLFISIFIMGIFIESDRRRKKLLFFLAVLILFMMSGLWILLIWLAFLIAPISCLALLSYGLRLRHLSHRRPIYKSEALTLVSIATLFAISVVVFNWYMSLPYNSVSTHNVGIRSYHLITSTGYGDPTFISLYQCNILGFLCEEIYAPNDYYDDDYDKFHWEISDNNTAITICVNNKSIHTEIIQQHP